MESDNKLMAMKSILLFVSLLTVLFSQAQTTISRQIIGSTGGSFNNATIDVNYSVGEAVITTVTSGPIILTQGFQQTDIGLAAINEIEISHEITVYPNPTGGVLNIAFSENVAKNGTVNVRIYDLQGKLVFQGIENANASSGGMQLDLSSLHLGQYLVHFTDAEGRISRAKFVKF